jgi:predicted HTH transcriptional regulator
VKSVAKHQLSFTPESLQASISCGEDSTTQFKASITKSKDLAKEMVAFANSEGGIIIVGVSDDGTIAGLSSVESQELGQLIGNVANENIRHRNPILNSICKHILPYSGYGSGIKRMVSLHPAVEFINDMQQKEFRVIIPLLKPESTTVPSQPLGAQSEEKKAQLIALGAQSEEKKAQSMVQEALSEKKRAQSMPLLYHLKNEALSAYDLAQKMGKESKSGSFKRSLKEYLAEEYIEYTLPNKPKSRLQQYRLTEKGIGFLTTNNTEE